ncbi:hypothetical protein BST61_g2568 [Cercospora zeina]
MALGLSLLWSAPCDELSEHRYHVVLRNNGKRAVSPSVHDLQPLISSSTKLVPCLEMHLDLTAQSCLSRPYETRIGRRHSFSDTKPELKSVAFLIGKDVVLERRLQLALTIASYIRALFGTPFLDSSYDKNDFGVLTGPGQMLDKEPVYLRRELFAQQMAVGAMSASSQVILLTLGIMLLELYRDEDAQAYFGRSACKRGTAGSGRDSAAYCSAL